MFEKVLLYSPTQKAKFVKSPFYAVCVFLRVGALCAEYLAKAFFSKTPIKLADEYIKRFWQINFDQTHTSLYAVNRENIIIDRPCIFLSNHESWMDFPAMFGASPQSLRMVSKEGLMKIPIFGHAMEEAGFIAIDRKNRVKAIAQLEKAKKRLREGISIWMAPEGTRTRSGEIGTFKKGGFYLALDLQVPIVPVYIEGAREIMPPDTLQVFTNKNITVHFLKPIDSAKFDRATIKNLIEEVRNRIIERKEYCEKLKQEN